MRALAFLLPALLLPGCGGQAVPEPPVPVAADAPSGPWTGEILVALSGCTSCADCRSAIRQYSQVQSGSDRVEFRDGVVRVVYPEAAPVRVKEVAGVLAGSLLLPKVHVDKVELRLAGEARTRGEETVFVASGTGEVWSLAEGKVAVPLGQPVVILAAVQGWKGEGRPSLRVEQVEARP